MTRLCLLVLFLLRGLAFAAEAPPLAQDPVVEQRLLTITGEMRCLVCQNETLADSHADLAEDLRREVREMIKAGKSDQEIMDFMVNRYGDFVRYRPAFKPLTLALWLTPFVLLLLALYAIVRMARASRQEAPQTLDANQRQQAQALLNDLESHS